VQNGHPKGGEHGDDLYTVFMMLLENLPTLLVQLAACQIHSDALGLARDST